MTWRAASRLALALALGCAAAAGPARAAAPMAGDARGLFDRALRTTRDARASFTQTQHGPLGDVVTRGTFEYLRPRRVVMRWTGKAAATAWVVADTVWFDQPGQGAVVRGNARAMGAPAGLFVDRSLADLERGCRVTARGPAALVLTPRDPGAAWSRLTLTLDPSTGWPRAADLVARDGGTTRLAFARFALNRGLPAARFTPRFAPGRVVTGWNP